MKDLLMIGEDLNKALATAHPADRELGSMAPHFAQTDEYLRKLLMAWHDQTDEHMKVDLLNEILDYIYEVTRRANNRE